MKALRISISSPGDVKEERDRACQVVESLRRRYSGKFFLKPLLSENLSRTFTPPFPANTSWT